MFPSTNLCIPSGSWSEFRQVLAEEDKVREDVRTAVSTDDAHSQVCKMKQSMQFAMKTVIIHSLVELRRETFLYCFETATVARSKTGRNFSTQSKTLKNSIKLAVYCYRGWQFPDFEE